jgi:hypothetical protein
MARKLEARTDTSADTIGHGKCHGAGPADFSKGGPLASSVAHRHDRVCA